MKTHLDLFSGIGGFALAASWAGFRTIGFCEYEDFPRRVLSARFPGVPIHGDIRELNGEQYRGVSLITGGFPCQPFSVAGQQAGKADDRYLWPEMLRVIAQAQPDWVVAENVTGIVTLALDQVLSDLESEGYACGTVVLPACAVDAPHRRDRVWIVARNVGNSTSWGRSAYWSQPRSGAERMGEKQANRVGSPSSYVAHSGYSEPSQWVDQERCGEERQDTRDKTRTESASCSSHVANSGSGRRQGGELQAGRNEPRLCGTDVANPNPNAIQGLESWAQSGGEQRPAGLHGGAGSTPSPDWWEVEPPVGRVANGIPKRVDRLRGLGNAIVPQVAYEILRLLIEK